MLTLYTEAHKKKIQQLYETTSWYGKRDQYFFQLSKQTPVEHLLLTLNPKTVLDYGSGNGLAIDKLEKLFPNIQFTKFDPFVSEHASRPSTQFDLVISHRVMRSVEPKFKQLVFEDMYNYTLKYLLIEILLYDIDNIPYKLYDDFLSKYIIVDKGLSTPVLRPGSDGVDHYIANAGYLISK